MTKISQGISQQLMKKMSFFCEISKKMNLLKWFINKPSMIKKSNFWKMKKKCDWKKVMNWDKPKLFDRSGRFIYENFHDEKSMIKPPNLWKKTSHKSSKQIEVYLAIIGIDNKSNLKKKV